MFGVGSGELVLIFVIGLLVLGPERLPKVASEVGRWVGRARRTAAQLRHQLEREIALSEITEAQRRRDAERPPPARPSADTSRTGGDPAAASTAAGAEVGATSQSAPESASISPDAGASAPAKHAAPAAAATPSEDSTSQ